MTFSGLFGELASEICFPWSFSTRQISTLTPGCEWAGASVANLWLRALSSPGLHPPELFAGLVDGDLAGVLMALRLRQSRPGGLPARDKVAGRLWGAAG